MLDKNIREHEYDSCSVVSKVFEFWIRFNYR